MDFKELFGEELATQIEQVATEKGLNFIVDNKEKPNYIPKDRFNEVIGSKNELKTQVSELTSQLDNLKKSAKGNEELTKAIEELQNKNTEWESKYQKSILENAIKMKAIQEKARDINDLGKFLDYNELKLDEEGNVIGLDEQLNSLKENKSYLFESQESKTNNNALKPSDGTSLNSQSEHDKYDELYRQAIANPKNRNLQHMLFSQKRKLFSKKE